MIHDDGRLRLAEMLRRQVIREFPDRVTTGSPEGIAHSIAARMREARSQAWHGRPEDTSDVGDDARLAALERLAKLRDSNVLSDEEFAAEKQRILAKAG